MTISVGAFMAIIVVAIMCLRFDFAKKLLNGRIFVGAMYVIAGMSQLVFADVVHQSVLDIIKTSAENLIACVLIGNGIRIILSRNYYLENAVIPEQGS